MEVVGVAAYGQKNIKKHKENKRKIGRRGGGEGKGERRKGGKEEGADSLILSEWFFGF